MTAVTSEHIELLVQLQEKDKEIDRLTAASDDASKQIQARKDALAAEKKALATAQENGKKVAVAKKSKELELAEKEAAIKKHQNELNAVKSNEAFKALMVEIDRGKAEASAIEDGILQLMEDAEAAVKAEK